MRSLKASGFMALGAALAVAGASVPFSGAISSVTAAVSMVATAPVTTVANADTVEAKPLTLKTTADRGTVTFGDLRQEFTSTPLGNCLMLPTADSDSLLDLKGYIGLISTTAGFKNGQIGVYEFTEQDGLPSNAAKCSEIDTGSVTPTETLGLHLGVDAVDASGAPLVATSATLEFIANSNSGSATVTLVDADGSQVGNHHQISWNRGSPLGTMSLTGEFSGILVQVSRGGGSLSLTGAMFDLESKYDGVLDCGDTTGIVQGEGGNPGVTVTRLDNADATEVCEEIPYRLRNDNEQVQFLKPLDEQTTAQFILDIEWIVSPANTDWQSDAGLLPETVIDYEQGGDGIALRWCPDVTTDEAGNPIGEFGLLGNDDAVDQEPVLDGKQFTCIVSQSSRIIDIDADPDVVAFNQKIYLLGDAVYRFK